MNKSSISRLSDALLVFGAISIPLLFAGWYKPIWIDEYLQFALGGMDLSDAIQTIWDTTGDGVNWGQTGTYFFANYALESLFGANLFVIRLPSILAAVALLGSAIIFLRLNGISRTWQFILLFFFLSQPSLMDYAGEARPYLPMASFAVAALTYYRIPFDHRTSWWARLIGVYAFLIGAVFHPYWIFFLTLTLLFSYWHYLFADSRQGSWSLLRKFVNIRFLLPGLALYIIIALLTWLKGQSGFQADPYQFMQSTTGFVSTIFSTHFSIFFLPDTFDSSIPPVFSGWLLPSRALALLVPLLFTAIALFCGSCRKELLPPLVLLYVALFSTAVLSALSYIQEYWILQRQWLAGMALTTVAIVWFLGTLAMHLQLRNRVLGHSFLTVVLLFSGVAALRSVSHGLQAIDERRVVWSEFYSESRTPQELIELVQENGDWVYLGNVNISRGGPVWPEVSGYYGIFP